MAIDKIRLLIIGAGKAGRLVASNIQQDKDTAFQIIGFIDDDKDKVGTDVDGINVLGMVSDLHDIATEHLIDEVLIAIPSSRGASIRTVVNAAEGTKLSFKIIPRQAEVLLQGFGEDYRKFIRRVVPEDLLGGEIVKEDQKEISNRTKKETVLITGAAGSIGSELSRQMMAHGAKRVVLYDWWENGMFHLANQLKEIDPSVENIHFIIGDIKDRRKLNKVMEEYRPTTIFHAAAYKHVPLMESNAPEAIKNNILGTKTVAELAIKNSVKKFVLISTDKAVNPTNIMGATKRSAEMLLNILSQSQTTTVFSAVRFGNVINSNGSAIPTFQKQIERGGPVGVTHKDITRFFMTIPEAVHLILRSWIIGENNDLFVLDMGEPVRIFDLAKTLIILNGYVPEEEVKIEIIGLRPGEKLYEEVLVQEEETKATSIDKVFKTKNYVNFEPMVFLHNLSILSDLIDEDGLDVSAVKRYLKMMVSTYVPNEK
ncbi:MAG TPA: nucleoside-diphosphate sugar epimerase/dehydratase [Candidatus Saccharimonadales bacterium]|nr:nucleoside-diphosphate sugar epimerase/dehydratase [Candidatus Saccharimonadales bacterium]